MNRKPDNPPPIGAVLSGPHWPDRVRVVRVEPRGTDRVLIEAVTLDEQARLILSRLLKLQNLDGLEIEAEADHPTLTGDPTGFRLAAEATRIRLAHTYDPRFAVSVSRIDPLPHQLEAVYYYLLRQPRLRFLLVDDPDAGKTIMAGLPLKELKLRGAIIRTLIVAPANLAPQWQREMAEKFDEPFDLVNRAALNARGSRAWEITDQCVVSLDFAWRADVLESLARAHRWDLIVVDEAHKMAPPERYRTEQEFRSSAGAQVMVATEAAGEGINLQFRHLMINYDLPWNPTRLEQRMGRIHRYGQKYIDTAVDWGLDHVLDPYLARLQERRQEKTGIIRDYLQRSFDMLHRAAALWESGDRDSLTEFLAEGARGREDHVRLVAQTLINILPDDDAEWRLLEGFLAGRDVLPEAPKQKRLL
jgi:hypothetical protein